MSIPAQAPTSGPSEAELFSRIAAQGSTPSTTPGNAENIFDTLAKHEMERMAHDQSIQQSSGNAENIFDQLAKNNGKLPDTSAASTEPEKPYNPAEHGALSRFGHAFAEPFKSAYHGLTDQPEDVNEVIAHANGGQGGLIAFRAAKKLIEAHDTMAKAKPGPAFRQAVGDFQNAAIDLMLGNKRDALMHGLSGGLSTVGAAEPGLQGVLERPRAISEGAASGGDLATPLGSTGRGRCDRRGYLRRWQGIVCAARCGGSWRGRRIGGSSNPQTSRPNKADSSG